MLALLRSKMKTLLFVPLLISLVACNTKTTESVSSGGVVNPNAPHIWGNKTFPKTVYLSEDFTPAEVTNITDMSQAWADSLELPLGFLNIQSATVTDKSNLVASSDDLRDSVFAIYRTTNWPSDLPNALAVTQIFGTRHNAGDSDEYLSISHADILINYGSYHSFRTNDVLIANHYDLQTVVLHEMGHFIGLGHRGWPTDQDSTVMYPTINTSKNKRDPKPIDIIDVADKYGISLSTTPAITAGKKEYKPRDAGTSVKVLIELYPDGECIHRENGKVIERHPASFMK